MNEEFYSISEVMGMIDNYRSIKDNTLKFNLDMMVRIWDLEKAIPKMKEEENEEIPLWYLLECWIEGKSNNELANLFNTYENKIKRKKKKIAKRISNILNGE